MTCQLDTSGEVLLPHPTPEDPGGKWASDPVQWSDLSPFTQGYIEALFASVCPDEDGSRELRAPAFSDLAPETLDRIIADCEAFVSRNPHKDSKPHGGWFWDTRQAGARSGFPPLTVQLGDDGTVRFAPTPERAA